MAVEEGFPKFIFFLGIALCAYVYVPFLRLAVFCVPFTQNGFSFQIYHSWALWWCENDVPLEKSSWKGTSLKSRISLNYTFELGLSCRRWRWIKETKTQIKKKKSPPFNQSPSKSVSPPRKNLNGFFFAKIIPFQNDVFVFGKTNSAFLYFYGLNYDTE